MRTIERPVWSEVDLGAIAHNVHAMKSSIGGGVRLCAVVKADGYGHGALQVAHEAMASGADMLAVAIPTEGVELRKAGFTKPILILGHVGSDLAPLVAAWDLEVPCFSLDDARALSAAAAALETELRIHIKIDTGMGRIGVRPEGAADLAVAISRMPSLRIEGAFSHFASADSADLGFAREQLSLFLEAIAEIERRGIPVPVRHIANSAAVYSLPESRLDMVRCGILLYGLRPSLSVPLDFEPRPAMSLKARISMIKEVEAGVSIGYGRSFFSKRASRVATLPIGYADGWPRALSGVSVGTQAGRAPIVGRICMDQCMVDVTDIGEVRADDLAILFGPGGPSIDEIADALGTINYEVVCEVGRRVPRVYVNGSV